jgi:phosphohistidine phosphatase
MLSLILFRHAKSDWSADYANDHDRPLAQRGMRAAKTMGNFLAAINKVPELALTSSAKRARDTLDLAARQGNWGCPIMVKPEIYESDTDTLMELLHSFDEKPRSLLLTGHEPTFSEMTSRLIGDARIRFPSGAMARIDFDVESWHQVRFGEGELRWLLPPKLLTKSGAEFHP